MESGDLEKGRTGGTSLVWTDVEIGVKKVCKVLFLVHPSTVSSLWYLLIHTAFFSISVD